MTDRYRGLLACLVVITLLAYMPLAVGAQGSRDIAGEWVGDIPVEGAYGSQCEDPSGVLLPGKMVRLKAADGSVLAQVELGSGYIINLDGFCSYPFKFVNVPELPEYTFEIDLVGRAVAAPVSVSLSQLQAVNWYVRITIHTSVYVAAVDGNPAPTAAPQPTVNSTAVPTSAPTQEPEPTATPPPVPEVQRQIILFLHEDVMQQVGTGCGLTGRERDARLLVVARPGSTVIRFSIDKGGTLVDERSSPVGEPGCLFTFDVTFTDGKEYNFRIWSLQVAKADFDVLQSQDQPLLLAFDQYGSRTPAMEGLVVPTPEPTPTPRPPTPTPIPTPEAGQIDKETYRIVGRLVLRSENVVNTSTGCYGTGGYSDVSDGAQIIIRDGNNNILGTGRLEDTEYSSNMGCSYIFVVEVSETQFYQIEFSHRSPLVYTFEEMETFGWELYLSLGD